MKFTAPWLMAVGMEHGVGVESLGFRVRVSGLMLRGPDRPPTLSRAALPRDRVFRFCLGSSVGCADASTRCVAIEPACLSPHAPLSDFEPASSVE